MEENCGRTMADSVIFPSGKECFKQQDQPTYYHGASRPFTQSHNSLQVKEVAAIDPTFASLSLKPQLIASERSCCHDPTIPQQWLEACVHTQPMARGQELPKEMASRPQEVGSESSPLARFLKGLVGRLSGNMGERGGNANKGPRRDSRSPSPGGVALRVRTR